MKLIYKYLKQHMVIFVISMTFLTLEALADLLQPTFMSYIVDVGVENADVKKILYYGAIMLCIAAVGAFSAVMRNLFASKTSQTIGKEIRHDIYENVQSLSLENIDRLKPASIITRITNDVTQVQDFINSMMRIMVKAPITGIGAITLIIIQTPAQSPVMIVILLIVSVFIICNINLGYPRFGIVQDKLDRLNGVSREFLSSVRVVKAFRAEDEETEKFAVASGNLAAANVDAMRIMAFFGPLISLTVNFGIVLLIWISGGKDTAHIGRVMASVNYMTQVLFALNMISMVINSAVRAKASCERITEVLDEKPVQKVCDNPVSIEVKGNISFDNVSFRYAGSSINALSDLNFEIHAGEMIGIIGPTGSGKSTLINLIPRFYDVTFGSIRVEGINVNEINEKDLRTAIAVVPQKALLFTGTIKENLLWGKESASESELTKALESACADDFVSQTRDGMESRLGQGGVNLSGGQKQRLSLARALLRKPKILILDDCTSALDAQTEAEVLKNISKLDKDMTVLLISQRISTVMKTDRILCMEEGLLKGFASHSDLMANCETYRKIYDSQIGNDDTDIKESWKTGESDSSVYENDKNDQTDSSMTGGALNG